LDRGRPTRAAFSCQPFSVRVLRGFAFNESDAEGHSTYTIARLIVLDRTCSIKWISSVVGNRYNRILDQPDSRDLELAGEYLSGDYDSLFCRLERKLNSTTDEAALTQFRIKRNLPFPQDFRADKSRQATVGLGL